MNGPQWAKYCDFLFTRCLLPTLNHTANLISLRITNVVIFNKESRSVQKALYRSTTVLWVLSKVRKLFSSGNNHNTQCSRCTAVALDSVVSMDWEKEPSSTVKHNQPLLTVNHFLSSNFFIFILQWNNQHSLDQLQRAHLQELEDPFREIVF